MKEIIDSYTEKNGTKWIRIWKRIKPGIEQLVWIIEK